MMTHSATTTITSPTKSSLLEFDSTVLQYIEQSNNIHFNISLHSNIYSPWLDDITIKLITKFGDYTKKKQLVLGETIVRKESYIAGYNKPIFSSNHFYDRFWDKFKKQNVSHHQ